GAVVQRSSGVAFAKSGSKRTAMSGKAKSGDPWAAIETHELALLGALFEADTDRVDRMSIDVAGIRFDWAKTHLDGTLVAAFEQLAEVRDLAGAREALFSGAVVN